MPSFFRQYPLSVLCFAAIVWLSLTWWFPEMPTIEAVPFYDKWGHFVMYGGWCSVIWWELHRHPCRRPWIWAIMLPAMTGGLLELAQTYLTTYRSGDWMDFLANCVGVLIGFLVSMPLRKLRRF